MNSPHYKIKVFSKLLVFACGVALFNNCEESDDRIWLWYAETYCSDPWGEVSAAEEVREQEILQFLKSEGINVFQIEIMDGGTVEHCRACHCTTGKLIKCRLRDTEVGSMKAIGFFK